MAQSDQIKEITAKLEQGVKDLFESGKYAAYLKTMSRFHKYSTRNTILIHMQDPTANRVGGFNFWKREFNRNVKKGEHGIKIFAPIASKGKPIEAPKVDPETKQPVLDEHGQPIMETLLPTSDLRMRFRVVTVFSERQTDGDPMPDLVEDLYGNVERYDLFLDALRAISPLPIVFEPMTDMDGYCAFGDKIGIREGMSEVQTVAAVVHELSHAKLHDKALLAENAKPKDRRTMEVESESCAYSVLAYYGIDTSANSIPYVLEWSKSRELKELNASLDTIRKATAEMIDAIDEKYRELAKERDTPTPPSRLGGDPGDLTIAAPPAAEAEPTPANPDAPDYSAVLAAYARNAEVRDPRQIGETILMTLLFEDGNLNRDGRRSRVKAEPPIGKYEMFSRDVGTPPHKTSYLYTMTACGKLADLGETERLKDLTEERLDKYILDTTAAFEKQLADPAAWADYTAAAFLDRIDEAESHNIPVRALREAERQAEREMRMERDKQLAAEKREILDARVDEIAKAIENGGIISVAYGASSYDGKNPVLELFKLYNVDLPLRTQGWVNNRLSEIKGEGYSFYTRNGGKASSVFMDCYHRLIRAVKLLPIEQKREQLNQQTTPRRGSEKKKMSIEQENYAKLTEMFPDFMSQKYSYMKLESRNRVPAEPLSLEWIFGDRICVMQTYVQEGDLMYDPMIEYTVNGANKSINAVSYENSGLGLYQYHDDDGIGRSVDGNGNRRTVSDLSGKLNEFTKTWFSNLEEQSHIPVRAALWNEGGIDDVDVTVTFDKDGNAVIEQADDFPETAEPTPKIGIVLGGVPLQVYDSETGYPVPTPPPKMKAEKPLQPEKQTTLDLSLPDPTVTAAQIKDYGYDYDGMFPMTTARAVELFDTGCPIYLLYPDGTEAMAFSRDEIRLFDGYCGIEADDWHNSPVYKTQMAAAADITNLSDARASDSNAREADLLYGDNPYYRENKFGIYQIRNDIDEVRDFRFASMKELEALGLTPNRDNYELVYTATLPYRIEYLSEIYPALNSLYEQFNIDHPADYTGRSMSVSDVVVLRCNGDITAHFVDSIGFVELSSFTGDEHTDAIISQLGKSVEAETPKQESMRVEKSANKEKPSILDDLDEAAKIAASAGNRDNNKKAERGYE